MRPIHLLQIEDSESDAALVVHLLRRSGFIVEPRRIDNEEQMRAALRDSHWDLVIADYCLPQFNAPDALRVFQEAKVDVPFLVVSGTIGEEAAVAMMKAGAHDYLIKDRMERLPAAVERELREAALRHQKRDADEKLRLANIELEAIYSHAPVLMLVVDKSLRARKVNELAAQFFETAPETCLGASLCVLLGCSHTAPASVEAQPGAACSECPLWLSLYDSFKAGTRKQALELWCPMHHTSQQKPRCLLVSMGAVDPGDPNIVLVSAQDVSGLKDAEASLKESVASLQAALQENTVLFQEVHHRVKNNLQIITSLLSMKALKDEHLITAEDLKDCERRVQSMALIHEQLYHRKDLRDIDFTAYIEAIVPALLSSFERDLAPHLRLEILPTTISLEQSIPCGLILNELITNAVKYAYPQGHGEIVVQLASDAQQVRLAVIDHGVGMPRLVESKKGSFGLELIDMLTKQLHGAIKFESQHGTSAMLTFPRR